MMCILQNKSKGVKQMEKQRREALVKARLALGLTQAQLAERSGVPVWTIARTEQGAYSPRVPAAKKLAAALGIDWTTIYE